MACFVLCRRAHSCYRITSPFTGMIQDVLFRVALWALGQRSKLPADICAVHADHGRKLIAATLLLNLRRS
jgi:hypothetical protein